MNEYILDKELVLSITDILKSVVPLIAALVASYLTYRFSKKDKIRDHLFTYKVKAYSALVQNIVETKRGLEEIRNSLYTRRRVDVKQIDEIWSSFRKFNAEQTLFLSDYTIIELNKLNDEIFKVVEAEILDSLDQIRKNDLDFILGYTNAIYECNHFIYKVKNELGIYKIHDKKFKWK